MRRNSSASSTASLSTPVAARTWGSNRPSSPALSLYPRAEAVLARFRAIDGMQPFFEIAERPSDELPEIFASTIDVVPRGEPVDAVSLLLRMFRLGGPLTLVYNLLHPGELHMIDPKEALDVRIVKKSIYHFISASAKDLDLKTSGDHFMVTQLFSTVPGDMLKPLQTVEMLLSRLDPAKTISPPASATSPASPSATSLASGRRSSQTVPFQPGSALTGPVLSRPASNSQLPAAIAAQAVPQTPPSPVDKRTKVVDELLQTERKYVQDMEVLQQFHDEMMNIGIPRETASTIAPQVAKLVEFQRRLLAGIEYQTRRKPEDQDIGWLFEHLISGFEIYKAYTIGQKEAVATAIAETTTLMPLSYIIEPMYELPSTLLKPVQRILRYPMLLKEILKRTPEDWPHYVALQSALAAMQDLTLEVNETQRRAENSSVSHELVERVRDWKNMDIGSLGELLLCSVLPVTSHAPDGEQEYHVYAFERCVLFFSDRAAVKRTPLVKMRPNSRYSQTKSMFLELRGRVYVRYITSVATTRTPAGHVMRIVWGHHNDASEHGFLDVRMHNEEAAQQWETTLMKQRARLRDREPEISPDYPSARTSRSASVDSMKKRSSSGSITAFRRNSSLSNSGTSNSSFASLSNPPRRQSQIELSMPEDVMPAQFWAPDTTPNPLDALRKLSVGSHSSQAAAAAASSAASTAAGTTPGTPTTTAPSTPNPSHSAAPVYTPTHAANTSTSSVGSRSSWQQRTPSTGSLNVSGQRKVRVYVDSDTFLLLIPADAPFENLVARVQRKLRLRGRLDKYDKGIKFQYVDEDEDLVGLESDEDMLMAFDSVPEQLELSIFAAPL